MDGITDAFETIVKAAESAQQGETYLDESDGLLHCSNCNEPRQKQIELLGKVRKVPIMCSCLAQKYKQEEEEQKIREWNKKIERLRAKGITDKNYLNSTFAIDDDKESKPSQVARKYCENFGEMKAMNQGLIFWGEPGTGKSFLAACIANRLIDNGVSAVTTSLPKLIDAIGADYGANKGDIMKQIADCDLLVLDDIGTERQTSTAYERVFEIIDTRYRAKKPLIVTTNLEIGDLRNPNDEKYKRLYDRILEMCLPVRVGGESKRGKIAVDKAQRTREILGL